MRNFRMKPVTAAIGSAFVASLASASVADTTANPFGVDPLTRGYNLFAGAHGGDAKEGEGKCGEGKCGEGMDGDGKDAEGKCGEATGDEAKDGEGKCGEGKCGEGKCGAAST